MFVPEYTITSKILKDISTIEYSKAVIESTVIMPQWEKQLQNQAIVDEMYADLQLENISISQDIIKKTIDNLMPDTAEEIQNIKNAIELTNKIGRMRDIDELDLKDLHKTVTTNLLPEHRSGIYRSTVITKKTPPEEILAEIVELFDWLNSIDARDSHPIIATAITRARLEQIAPFESFNTTALNLMSHAILQTLGYAIKNFVYYSSYYQKGIKEYKNYCDLLTLDLHDYTKWIEYFTQGTATNIANVQEKVKLLARDTKVAKVTGRTRLSSRQEKIIEYLQDYGLLQNKDFCRLFPEKSEDSILRDLKVLIDMGLVQKAGSTKSSRYELR